METRKKNQIYRVNDLEISRNENIRFDRNCFMHSSKINFPLKDSTISAPQIRSYFNTIALPIKWNCPKQATNKSAIVNAINFICLPKHTALSHTSQRILDRICSHSITFASSLSFSFISFISRILLFCVYIILSHLFSVIAK